MGVVYSSTSIFKQTGGHAGRVGGFFTFDGLEGKVFAMSNNHVIANLNDCKFGDAICLNNNAQTVIGTLYKWYNLLPLDEINSIDAAFFELTNNAHAAWNLPGGVINPAGMRLPNIGDEVYMNIHGDANPCYLDTTIPSRVGRIAQQVTTPLLFSFYGQHFYFQNLYEIHTCNTCPFSYPGDSGSFIFDYDNAIVGILIGGAQQVGQAGSMISYMAPLPVQHFANSGIRVYNNYS